MSGEAKAEYTAVYKCRLCGEKFTSSSIKCSRAKAAGIILSLAFGIDNNEPQDPTMQNIHYCNNGGIGIADFQGWEVKDET